MAHVQMAALVARLRERQRRGETRTDANGNLLDRESKSLASHAQVRPHGIRLARQGAFMRRRPGMLRVQHAEMNSLCCMMVWPTVGSMA